MGSGMTETNCMLPGWNLTSPCGLPARKCCQSWSWKPCSGLSLIWLNTRGGLFGWIIVRNVRLRVPTPLQRPMVRMVSALYVPPMNLPSDVKFSVRVNGFSSCPSNSSTMAAWVLEHISSSASMAFTDPYLFLDNKPSSAFKLLFFYPWPLRLIRIAVSSSHPYLSWMQLEHLPQVQGTILVLPPGSLFMRGFGFGAFSAIYACTMYIMTTIVPIAAIRDCIVFMDGWLRDWSNL